MNITMIKEALPVIEKSYKEAIENMTPEDPVSVAMAINSYKAMMLAKRMLGLVK